MIMDCPDVLIFISIYSNLFYDSLNVQYCGKINILNEKRNNWLWTKPYYDRSKQITSYLRSMCLRLQAQYVISDDTWKEVSGYWLMWGQDVGWNRWSVVSVLANWVQVGQNTIMFEAILYIAKTTTLNLKREKLQQHCFVHYCIRTTNLFKIKTV